MANQWTLSSALTVNGKPIQLVAAQGAMHPLFDSDDLKKALGATRYNNLIAKVKTDYVCGHRVDSKGLEIHCIAADDVEAFLKAGG